MKTSEPDRSRDPEKTAPERHRKGLETHPALTGPTPAIEEPEEKPVILVVDDDATIRSSLALLLESTYQLHLCASGQSGIDTVNNSVSAVILDIKMEGKDGFETFLEIKDRFYYLPIIFYSAYQGLKDPLEIINTYRPFGYVMKGGAYRQLLDTLESAVDYYRQIRRNQALLLRLENVNRQLEEKIEELEAKRALLRTYSSRLETLLACTKAMSISHDTYSAIRTASRFLMETVESLRDSKLIVYSYQKILNDSPSLVSYQLGSSHEMNVDPVSGVVSAEELSLLQETSELMRRDSEIWIPVEFEGERYAVFRFMNCAGGEPSDQDKDYMNGILSSLSHVHKNQRNFEQRRLATIGRMASGIVHDLNNNIGIIRGYAELADDVTLDREEQVEYLGLITREASRLSDMARDIMSYSRGAISLQKEDIDLVAYCDDVAFYLRPMFNEHEIEFTHRVTSPGTVPMDGNRFRRVIYNIAINACDAVGAGGAFTMEAACQGDHTIFMFTDNGPGIPEGIRDTIFQPFVSMGKSHGTGLGMAMSKTIVDSHGGEIYFESRQGQGTTFFVKLPGAPRR